MPPISRYSAFIIPNMRELRGERNMTEFMTVSEVAKILRMSPRQVQYRAQSGDLRSIKPFRKVLIYKDAVAQLIGCKVEEL